ncbi:fibropellin-1 [Elysia marginata]|uniref:Fibropellin-1 n=1 Tax=Elysia marginata TaxID=1093978 RepID=A0AAV4I538_9GAST|nr:fibropellin-1 [Elysia marginata]
MVEKMCQWTDYQYDLPHYDACHKYYDCTSSERSARSEDDMVRTCKYPQLFSVDSGKCEDFSKVDCGTRKEAMKPCDYTKCANPDEASCFGLPDGDNVYRTKEGSPHYVTCLTQRTLDKKVCPMDSRGLYMQFAPGVGRCLPLDASTLRD